jgi:hypothetical protein
MPGWGTRNVNHIVAVYGYSQSCDSCAPYIYYAETAANAAGFSGSYENNNTMSNFWNWVKNNSSQVW